MPDSMGRLTSAPAPDDLTTNLTFDTRIKSFPYGLQYRRANDMAAPSGNVLNHGYMLSASESEASPVSPQPRYMLHFLYNPSTITLAYSAQAARTPLPPVYRPENMGVPMVGTGGSLSWNLLYDRTYEVNDPTHPAYDMGVQYDIAVLQGLVGITTPMTPVAGADSEGSWLDRSLDLDGTTAATPRTDVLGIMQQLPVWATFGLKRNFTEKGRYASAMSVMKYFGYVGSLSITYTHWTQSMVPVRCAISLGMTLMANDGFSVPFS